MPIHHRPPPSGLLASARQWSQADAPTREQEMHRQRAMAGQPGYPSIGPPQSRMSRIWENLRHGIPRRTREFLEPETPAEMGGLLTASVVEPAGTAIDLADIAIGFKEGDLPRMGWATAGLFAPWVAGSTMRKVLGKGAKAADELPMDEASRMARAESQGFDTGTTFYHGTRADIDEFNPNPRDAYDSGWLGRGTYVTTNPATASAYAGMKAGAGGERVMPMYARLNDMKILDVDHSAKIVGQRVEMDQGREAARRWAADHTDELRAQGYDGVRVTYKAENVGSSAGEELLVFDPENLRSHSARFDPSKFESASLIAGGAGLLGVGMARQRERR